MKNAEKLKLKPIECYIYHQEDNRNPLPNPFVAKLDLYTGEVKFTNTSILFQSIKKMSFIFDEQHYDFPLKSLGGKMFVENHKTFSPFDRVNGLKILQQELQVNASIPKAKL